MANDKQETLEQAVSRICDKAFDDYNAMKHRTHKDAMDWALLKMAEWQREQDAKGSERPRVVLMQILP